MSLTDIKDSGLVTTYSFELVWSSDYEILPLIYLLDMCYSRIISVGPFNPILNNVR